MKRFLLCTILIPLLTCSYAQDTEPGQVATPERRWKGIDVDTVLNNPKYVEKGKTVLLYNIGTGRFIIDGGNWGIEGRLFHDDFGRELELMSSGYIRSGITESTNNNKKVYGNNVPGVSKPGATWDNVDKYTFTTILDAPVNYLSKWEFEPVGNDPEGTHTYYMYEVMKGKTYYLGAAWGEFHHPSKGDGQLVYLDDDRACWTTYDVRHSNITKEVFGHDVTLDALYQWRVISEEEFIKVLNEEEADINPSVSSLIPDRDFTRNTDDFETKWGVTLDEDYSYGESGRYGYTSGRLTNKQGQALYNNEAWDKPVRLKEVFEKTTTDSFGLKNAKFGFLSFEGAGRTSTTFVVPKPGWYKVQCYGFVKSDENDAYLFAKVVGSEETTPYGGEAKCLLPKAPANSSDEEATLIAYDKHTMEGCLEVGKELTYYGDKYETFVWICVTEDQFDAGMKTLEIGVGKDGATIDESEPPFTRNGKTYHYDTDWVCVDDFRAWYMGLGPVFFYEDEESLSYLEFDDSNLKQHQSSAPHGQYGGAANLERTLKKGEWNSFSFPLPLTGEQIKYAFGENAVLAKVNSIGGLSQNPNVIDFETINLTTSNYVVEKGVFYLLKPTADPTSGVDPKGNNANYYQLGRLFFSVNENESEDYTHEKLSLTTLKVESEEAFSSFDNSKVAKSYVNYVQTSDFANFSVNSDYLCDSEVENGIYAPKGAYVVSKGTICHINKDTPIKGFRGWLTINPPIGSESIVGVAFNGILDTEGNTDAIEALQEVISCQIPDDTPVFDITGRQVGVFGNRLPKGLYLVKGKKFIVE